MIWKLNTDEPVYIQLMGIIRGAVLAGEYPPGGRVPSVRELATAARVNPNTMQRALSELEREGVLVSQGTLGRTVTEDDAVLTALKERAVHELAVSCAEKFKQLGISPQKAGELLQSLEESEENEP